MLRLVENQWLIIPVNSYFLVKLLVTTYNYWDVARESTGKSHASGPRFTSFSRVLPTSRLGYYAEKLIENEVYCLSKNYGEKIM